MQNTLKQFGGKGTGSFDERFNRSILRLTLLYATALAVILFIAGTITYSAFSHRLRVRFRTAPSGVPITLPAPRFGPTAEEVRKDFIESVILVNGILLFIGMIASYLFARRTLQPIKDAYKRQQRFLSDASHELRTPLSILQIELENELTNSAFIESASSKLEEVKRMGKIVHDLLLLSRLDEIGKDSHVLQNMNVIEATKEVVTRMQSLAHSHGITLTCVSIKDNITIIGNEDLFSHAIQNFIKNAIVYNKPAGEVQVAITEQGKKVLLTITDTGRGIPEEELQHIFNRFYRIDESRSRETGGNGLGLSIAQSSLEKMNGTIAITSKVNVGTTVTLSFTKKS